MKQYVYKIIVFILTIVLIYEFTIKKQINNFIEKIKKNFLKQIINGSSF